MIKSYSDLIEINESMSSKPIKKFPIDYKVTHIKDIIEKLEKEGIDVFNLQPGVKTHNEYHDFNLFDFMGDKLQENVTFPQIRLRDLIKDPRNIDYIDSGSVILLPISYDSSKDEEEHKKYKEEGRKRLIETYKKLYKGDELKKAIENSDKHVYYGQNNFEWANIALAKIHELYKQYYIKGFLQVWMPYDFDSGNEFRFNEKGNTSHDYPLEKMYFLSDIEKYLKSNYNLEDPDFYRYILKNNYVDFRHYEKPYGLFVENGKFVRKGGKYGMNATENIDRILGVLEHEFKDDIKDSNYFEFYINYYKKAGNID